jgi:predicted lipoprotein with Yx(FWY)xxD motif
VRPVPISLILIAAASLALAACGSSGSSYSSAPATAPAAGASTSAAVVRSAPSTAVGATVLVDARGMTLYHLTGEQNGRFICTSSACLQVWHPLSAAGAPGGSVASLSTVRRPDGTMQVTYRGWPLYTFAQDQAAGQAKGQGLKDVGTWTAVTVSPAAATQTETTAPVKSGGSRYGY